MSIKKLDKLNQSIKQNQQTVAKPKDSTTVRSRVISKTIKLKKLEKVEAYKSNLSNLFTENDATLTEAGYVRQFQDTGYYGDIQKTQTIYEQDDLVAGLVDSIVNISNTSLNFELPSSDIKEQDAWRQWARTININTKGILPGSKILNEQLFMSMILTGMAVPDFEWGEIKVGQKFYQFPTKINIYPSLGVKLQTDVVKFGEEDVLLSISKTYKDTVENASTDVAYETQFIEFGKDKDGNTKFGVVRKNGYAIKYKYTPNNKTLYPTPLLKRSFESIALRHKLIDADISLLEMVISKFIQIKVGDEKNPPIATTINDDGSVNDGDIDIAQDLFESMTDEVEVIATPYNYSIEHIFPDTTVLLDQKKYVQSTYNILSNFGIIMDPNASSNSENFEKINLTNFENNAKALQMYVSAWYNWLAVQIIKRNKGKLKSTPIISFDSPDITDAGVLTSITTLFDKGVVDVFTLLEKHGLDAKAIKERLLIQHKEEDKYEGLYQVRATFKQETLDPAKPTDKKVENKEDMTEEED